MSKAPSKSTAAIQRLLEERRQYEAWIARIDAAGGAAPSTVRSRVRSDYEARLNAVTEELKVHAEAARLMGEGFASALNVRLEPGDLTARECAWAEELLRDKYASDTWTRRI